MKQRLIQNKTDRDKAFSDITPIEFPYWLGISRDMKESDAQRSLYFATIDDFLREIRKYVNAASENSGHTPDEIRALVSHELPWPQSAIMTMLTKNAAHECLKIICGVPTTIGGGKKRFREQFQPILEATMADILGSVKAITGRMM